MTGKPRAAFTMLAVGFALGYFAGHYSIRAPESTTSRLPQSMIPAVQTSQHGTELGTWGASLKIPASVQLPNDSPLIKCDFEEPPDIYSGLMHVTITNLVGQTYLVKLYVYGYDSRKRRVSDASEVFEIGGHETVFRQVFLRSQALGLQDFPFGRTFRVEVTLEE